MKNNFSKILISFLLVLCLSSFLVSCKKKNNDKPDEGKEEEIDPKPIEKEIYPIGLDISDEIKKYEIGDDLNTSSLKAKVVYSNGTRVEVTDKIVIDSHFYDKTKNGTYEIIIKYTEDEYLVKSFFLATVGTGIEDEKPVDPDLDPTVFGPGTYKIDASIDLAEYLQNALILPDTKFGGGYFIIKGSNSKRANATAFAIELVKSEGSWIEFNVTGNATVSISCSSTGSSNTSAIAIFDSENELVVNNENITTVQNTTPTLLTYTLTTGTYRILSQSGTSYSSRGVRIYSVTINQK